MIVVDELPSVTGDGNQLEQLFSNLVSNALEYSGAAPPRVEIAAVPGDGTIDYFTLPGAE